MRARTGKALFAPALTAAITIAAAAPAPVWAASLPSPGKGAFAAAATTPDYWFAGTRLVWTKAQRRGDDLAVATDDPGFARLLNKAGAVLSYDPGQRYAVITTGDRRTVNFTVGDPRYTVGGIAQSAPFAPYASGPAVYLPLSAVARALYLVPLNDGGTIVLQPQIGGLDIRVENRVTLVTFHGATPLRFKVISRPDDPHLALTFSGVGTTLERDRHLRGSAEVHGLTLRTGGTPRNPTTTVIFDAMRGTARALAPVGSQNDLAIGFAFGGVALEGTPLGPGGAASASANLPNGVHDGAPGNEYARVSPDLVPPEAAAPPPALSAPAVVSAIDSSGEGQGASVRIGVSGPVNYEWHRLADNRWYVDLKNATLGVPARDEAPHTLAIASLRVRQLSGPPQPVVRIALTLVTQRQVDLQATDSGFTIAVGGLDDLSPQRVGAGRITGGALVAAVAPGNSPASEMWAPSPQDSPAPAQTYVATNPKLIVIDPGHGGSDTGAARNGLVEKDINLDISKRLRAILLARGWQVKMTRETDVDVFAPNDSAHDELQARCDIANRAGARLFVSVHVNSFTSSSLNGTTTYYYKGLDQALGDAIHRRLTAQLSTADKGLRKEDFYVIKHTAMPAALVETAFLSNPGDAKLLHSAEFLQRVAGAIADGIGDYATKVPAANYSSGT